MWSNIQIAQKAWFRGMDWRMSDCPWQSQSTPPILVPPILGKPLIFVFNCPREVNGLCIRPTWGNQKEKACHLLPEQKIHRIWIQVPPGGKDMMCNRLDCSKAQTIFVIPFYLVDLQIGSHQVYFWKAIALRENCKIASLIVKVWHSICILEIN